MKNKWIFLLWLISLSATLFAQSTYRHKSEAEIAQMTPEQRVLEYCDHSVNHAIHFPNDYTKFFDQLLAKDGVKVFPPIIKILDEFDPAKMTYGFDKHFKRYEAVQLLLLDIDSNFFRVRGVEEGRNAIAASVRAYERMVARNNKYNKPSTDEMWRRVHLSWNFLELLKGVTISDQCVKDTLKVKYEVDLTEKELLDFVNYLIAHNPQYPSSSEREYSKTGKRVCVYKQPELFQQAYLEYKATKK